MKRTTSLFIILIAIQLMTAWLCGPYSCEWGNNTYFYTGLLLAAIAFAIPFLQKLWSIPKKIGIGLLFALSIVIMWLIGFMVFNFRIMCKLF